ncbi:MAG: L-2-hydroxyglutarate oxidase [Phycisphaerales bacterium]|nr:L-2-hydroxyglutarate oxidase [Phycisphaerales bacterium]
MNENQADILIIGGGIIGLATAERLGARHPDKRVILLEKEDTLAAHQTGRNSGVLHSGIYYKPGSLKATNCQRGKQMMEQFCAEQGIPFDICGKVIVAITDEEVPRLQNIYERGQANGVACEIIDKDRLHELEPHAAGVRAIHVPRAGIVDYIKVCARLGQRLEDRGGRIVLHARATALHEHADEVVVESSVGAFHAQQVVNCAGLHADRIARLGGVKPDLQIIPFRGEYYMLKPDARSLCRNLIYPVPDPAFPFLGVHLTRMIDGSVECGPNAVLAFAREGYTKTSLNLGDLAETLGYRGFWHLAHRHWRMGIGEMWRSVSRAAFVRALRRLVPDLRVEDVEPADAGVRAQAVRPDGAMVDDFAIQRANRVVHVCNAPSPAATSALSIGEHVVELLD